MFSERRKNKRYQVTEDLSLFISTDGHEWSYAQTFNISLSGIKFGSKLNLNTGEFIHMKIVNTSSEQMSLSIDGEIVRSENDYDLTDYGVAFEALLDDEEERLGEIIEAVSI